jgi:hypothetical protein
MWQVICYRKREKQETISNEETRSSHIAMMEENYLNCVEEDNHHFYRVLQSCASLALHIGESLKLSSPKPPCAHAQQAQQHATRAMAFTRLLVLATFQVLILFILSAGEARAVKDGATLPPP